MKAFILYRQLYDFFGSQLMIGGIETYILSLFEVLVENGYEPEMIQCAVKPFRIMHNGTIPVRGYCAKGSQYQKILYKQIQGELQPDDMVIFGTDTNCPCVAHRKTLSIQHGIDFDYYPLEEKRRLLFYKFGLGFIIKYLQRFRARESFNHASYRVCVDYNFWNWYRTFSLPHQDKNIFVIPNFAPIPNKFINRPEGAKLRVLFARRFVRRRGVEVLINAIRILNQQNYDAVYTFAGDGPLEETICSLAKEFQNVHITRYTSSEALELHMQHDIAVIPTIGSEGTSFSLLEAMAAGNAVICTPVGGMSNIILDGYNGIFVYPDSAKDLAKMIAILLQDQQLRDKLAKNARETVQAAFSKEVWKMRWKNALNKVTADALKLNIVRDGL